MAVYNGCSGQMLIQEIIDLNDKFENNAAKQIDLEDLSSEVLKTRFGGIQLIASELSVYPQTYVPPSGYSYVGKLSTPVDGTEYISYVETTNSSSSSSAKIYAIYACNIDNTIQKLIWTSEQVGSSITIALDGTNNQMCIKAYKYNSKYGYVNVYRIEPDLVLSTLYSLELCSDDYIGVSFASYGTMFIYNNALYGLTGSSSDHIQFVKIDYSDVQNPITTKFSTTPQYELYMHDMQYDVVGEDLYVFLPSTIYKYIGGVSNCDAIVEEFSTPLDVTPHNHYYTYTNSHIYCTKYNNKHYWENPSKFYWFTNDKFYQLSQSLFRAVSLWSGNVKDITIDKDYMLVMESSVETARTYGNRQQPYVILYLINCRTNEVLWRYPFVDMVGTRDVVLNSDNFEFSICYQDGYIDTYKIIFSDEIGW